ncbi:hypothetical protein AUR64_14380 [Haloprofundus marisrubri]|uniref:Uncharacterized protein n=1 Tax=Haloprofundus marisrubri TaxID=1514971 RepID=A0A0W1R6E1_9EURY|nr:hypothetical protein [Haloprofundus marisrubri]KTG08989.1 hypothetical protein AUR64_14380 [Haloprofundus marisrubri]
MDGHLPGEFPRSEKQHFAAFVVASVVYTDGRRIATFTSEDLGFHFLIPIVEGVVAVRTDVDATAGLWFTEGVDEFTKAGTRIDEHNGSFTVAVERGGLTPGALAGHQVMMLTGA